MIQKTAEAIGDLIGNNIANKIAKVPKKVEKAAPLKYLSNFWRTLEMPLVNCEISLLVNLYDSIFSENYVIFSALG